MQKKYLAIALTAGALLCIPFSYALGQTQGEEKSKTEQSIEQKVAKSTKIDLNQQITSRSFKQQKDGQTFTCLPPVEGGELPLFMTAGYCQNLCGNDTPVYVANWQGSGQSLCYCSVKNRTYIY